MKKYVRLCAAFVFVTLFTVFFFSLSLVGANNYNPESSEMVLQSNGAHEVILLYDISDSMGLNDADYLAADSFRQIAAALPSYWHIGLVTFNTAAVNTIAPDLSARADIDAVLSDIDYGGYTNPGAGLLQAAELFSDNALSRTIIFLASAPESAAEVAPDSAYLTEHAIEKIIASEIYLYMIVVGRNREYICRTILELPRATDGHLFLDIPSELLSLIADMLTGTVLGIPRILLEPDGAGTFSAQLPTEGLNSAKVLIMTESELNKDHITVHGDGNISIQVGQRFAVVEVLSPTSQKIEIDFGAESGDVAFLFLEWNLQLMMNVYGDSTRFWFMDSRGQNAFLNPFFEQEFFPIFADEIELNIDSGYLYWDADGEELLHILRNELMQYGIAIPDSVIPLIYEPVTDIEPDGTEGLEGTEEPDDANGYELDGANEDGFNDTGRVNFNPMWIIGLIVLIAVIIGLIILINRASKSREKSSADKLAAFVKKSTSQSKLDKSQKKPTKLNAEEKILKTSAEQRTPAEVPKKPTEQRKPTEVPKKPTEQHDAPIETRKTPAEQRKPTEIPKIPTKQRKPTEILKKPTEQRTPTEVPKKPAKQDTPEVSKKPTEQRIPTEVPEKPTERDTPEVLKKSTEQRTPTDTPEKPPTQPIPVTASTDKPLEPVSLKFSGKIEFFMTSLSDKTDTKPSPHTFQLSRPGKPQEKSLQEIMKKFKLSNPFSGSDKIIFAANDQGHLQVKNGSDCKVFIGADTIVNESFSTLRQGEVIRIHDRFAIRELVITPQFS